MCDQDDSICNQALTAVFHDDCDGVLTLLKQSPELITSADINGNTVLHIVKSKRMLLQLLASDADVNAQNVIGFSPLHSAIWSGRDDVARALIESGSQPNLVSHDGASALHVAADEGNAGIIPDLVQAGWLINAQCAMGWTPLHYAAMAGSMPAMRVLLDLGACRNLQANGGYTAMNFCEWNANEEGIALLSMP